MSDGDWLDKAVAQACTRLADDFAGTFSVETVRRYVDDSRARWADARVTTYLPIMIERRSPAPAGPGQGGRKNGV